MVKITLEYPSIDAAIVAMAKLTKADGVTIVDGKARKGRADAGKPRGQYNKKGAGEGAATDANTGAAPSPAAPTETTEPAAASSVSSVANQGAIPEGTSAADNSATKQPAAPERESPPAPGKDHEPVAASSVPPEATAYVAPTAKDAEAALEALFQAAPPKGGLEAARAVLAKFGVAKLRDLPASQRAHFIKAVAKALE